MKAKTALWLSGAVSVATLATIGWLGYRIYTQAMGPQPVTIPPDVLARSALPQIPLEEAQQIIEPLFALTLPDLSGKPQAMSQWRGKILVVNYWASWCGPCIEEMPLFSRMARHYAAWGVQFIGIGLDEAEKLRAFAQTTPVSYPLLHGGTDAESIPGLQAKALPYTMVIDRDGKVALTRMGKLDEATLEPVLRTLIEKR